MLEFLVNVLRIGRWGYDQVSFEACEVIKVNSIKLK